MVDARPFCFVRKQTVNSKAAFNDVVTDSTLYRVLNKINPNFLIDFYFIKVYFNIIKGGGRYGNWSSA